ncbi:multiprotein-bridging factor 1 family protein [Haloplanus rallus]|jgi:ribosome-binding protein aMBF1 (putative translation factor)|uniref:Multiprotein-bridging factor 1 family protein n=1 Tax=Haloplanus rallus TaxID=1816183 RepID=A0A6B9F1M4_9EURY|nr:MULTISPECIES: transcriptional regulator [Haloplanus]QGX94155.1 multiprotein-bridging factor 1 family protein [Haloplanus rallus]
MAKYSTGSGGGGDDGDACELCGRETSSLERATVAGAKLLVCSECAPHGDTGGRGSDSGSGSDSASGSSGSRTDADEPNRRKRAARNTARVYDAARSNTKRWEEEGTDYESDRLPYLVTNYGDRIESARQDAGLTVEELAAELDADEADVRALEEGRATRAGVGGSLVRAVEERFGIDVVDE